MNNIKVMYLTTSKKWTNSLKTTNYHINQDKVDNQNNSLTIEEIKLITKKFPQKKSLGHYRILPNI